MNRIVGNMFKVRARKIQTLIMEVMIEFLGLPYSTIVLLAGRHGCCMRTIVPPKLHREWILNNVTY